MAPKRRLKNFVFLLAGWVAKGYSHMIRVAFDHNFYFLAGRVFTKTRARFTHALRSASVRRPEGAT